MSKGAPFTEIDFVGSFMEIRDPFLNKEGDLLPEVAIVGKSNVGKSSLINHLFNRKKVAFVSSTPGKTYTLNFFKVDDKLILVDLPGYGYAKRDLETRETWAKKLDQFFKKRQELKLILLLIDSRREPSDDDLSMASWAHHHKKPLLLILTKSDTLSPRELKNPPDNLMHALEPKSYVYYSTRDGACRKNLIKKINECLF
jgi:GTP-binding protein